MKNKEIFELYKIEYHSRCFVDDNTPQYPSFEVDISRVGLFLSLTKAEQGIKKYIDEEKTLGIERLENIFGFLINEFELDTFTYWWTKSKRNYLPDGSLWDECLISDHY